MQINWKTNPRVRIFRVFVWVALTALSVVDESLAQTEVFENVVLCDLTDSNDLTVLKYDGFRTSALAPNATISERGDYPDKIADLDSLAKALGTKPNLDKATIGDEVGATLGDALFANVTTNDGVVTALEVTGRRVRPLVGVSWTGVDAFTKGQRVIVEAALNNGMRAYLIPQVVVESDCDAYLARLDAFVMPGGTNFDPARYGEEPYVHGSANIDRARDQNDVLITRWIIAHNVPGLWICRGVQALNVSLGGGLIQDVPTYLAQRTLRGEIPYREAEPIPDEGAPGLLKTDPKTTNCVPPHYRVRAYGVTHLPGRHSLGTKEEPGVSDSSKWLKEILGANFYPSVLTSHHQAVNPERVGSGLTVVARAPDGIIEALEYQDNWFALGTQFHPEMDTLSDDKELQRFGHSFFKALRVAIETRPRESSHN